MATSGPTIHDQLKEISANNVRVMQENFKQYKSKVQSLKPKDGQTPEPGWEKLINEEAAKEKTRNDEAIATSTKEIVATIEKLPPKEREPAAKHWVSLQQILMRYLAKIGHMILQVADAVINWVEGAWDKVEEAAEEVASWTKQTLESIAGSFVGSSGGGR